MPLGSPLYSATSDHSPAGEMRKMRPNGMSVTYRLPAGSNTGPSRKLSMQAPPLLASAHSERTPVLRKCAGMAEKTWREISRGTVLKYMFVPCCPGAAQWRRLPTYLLGLHIGGFCHLAPQRGVVLDAPGEVSRRNAARLGAHAGQALLHLRAVHALAHLRLQFGYQRRGRAFGRRQAKPVDDLVI